MAITVGLDFGTHQTKICIENSDTPLHKTYEFFDWGNRVYALPTVIQINKDHTLRYGSIDLASCLVGRKKKHVANPSELQLPPKPEVPKLLKVGSPKLPPMPVHKFVTTSGFSMSLPYKDLYGIDSTTSSGSKPSDPNLIATKQQKEEYQTWKDKCARANHPNSDIVKKNQALQLQYQKDLKSWEDKCASFNASLDRKRQIYNESLTELPLVYRYFKQATYAQYLWEWEIKPEDLTVLYLAYIIFRLEERFGNNFALQMGIPASENTFQRLKKYASGHLVQAYRLVEDVFQNDFERFLSTPYEKLLNLIPIFEYSDDLKYNYGLIILPEAYAALRSVTVNSRIPEGMSILLDIGGGTTDISFFTIEGKGKNKGEPYIYHFESISKGLNFFLEYEDRQSHKSIEATLQNDLNDISKHAFKQAQTEYNTNIEAFIVKLLTSLNRDAYAKGHNRFALINAINNRPIIYTGGGSSDNRMRRKIKVFTDIKYLNKDILNIRHVVNDHMVNIPYSLLATAFGLSISRNDDNIRICKKEDLIVNRNGDETSSNLKAHREHGMYED